MFGFEVRPTCGGKGHSVGEGTVSGNTAHHTDAETEVREADQRGGKAVCILEDICEGGEEKIEVAVDESHVG